MLFNWTGISRLKNVEGVSKITDYFQKLQKYFGMAKIDYYSGSTKELQKLIFQATGNFIPLNVIEEYMLYADGPYKPAFLP